MFSPTATEEDIAEGMTQIQFKEIYILKREIEGKISIPCTERFSRF